MLLTHLYVTSYSDKLLNLSPDGLEDTLSVCRTESDGFVSLESHLKEPDDELWVIEADDASLTSKMVSAVVEGLVIFF